MVPPTQLPLGSRASSRSSPATANSFSGACANSNSQSATLISLPVRFFIGRPSFRLPKENERRATRCGSSAVVGPSWRQGSGVAEEARTRGFVSPAFAGFAFLAAVLVAATQYDAGGRASRPSLRALRPRAKFVVRPENGPLAFALTPPLRRHSDPEDRPDRGPDVILTNRRIPPCSVSIPSPAKSSVSASPRALSLPQRRAATTTTSAGPRST